MSLRNIFLALSFFVFNACTQQTIPVQNNEVRKNEPKTTHIPTKNPDLRCLGTEPFWNIALWEKERIGKYTFLSEHIDSIIFTIDSSIHQTYYRGKIIYPPTEESLPIHIHLKKTKCSDGMSDKEYPYESFILYGKDSLKGCALLLGS
jgi:uncharacterized membrane protein